MKKFLKHLSKNIDYTKIDANSLDGFSFPNNFNIENLKQLLYGENFSTLSNAKILEFCWAINESDVIHNENIEKYLQLYCISIFLYGYRKTECIDILDEIYFFSFTQEALLLDKKEKELAIEFLLYLEKYVPFPDRIPPNNDIFLGSRLAE